LPGAALKFYFGGVVRNLFLTIGFLVLSMTMYVYFELQAFLLDDDGEFPPVAFAAS